MQGKSAIFGTFRRSLFWTYHYFGPVLTVGLLLHRRWRNFTPNTIVSGSKGIEQIKIIKNDILSRRSGKITSSRRLLAALSRIICAILAIQPIFGGKEHFVFSWWRLRNPICNWGWSSHVAVYFTACFVSINLGWKKSRKHIPSKCISSAFSQLGSE